MNKATQELKTRATYSVVGFLLLAAAFGFNGFILHDRTTSLGSKESVVQQNEPKVNKIQKQTPVLVQQDFELQIPDVKKTDTREQYTVKSGDTYWIITQKFLPQNVEAPDFMKVLKTVNGKKEILQVGQVMLIPNAKDLINVVLPDVEILISYTDEEIINHLKQVEGTSQAQAVQKRRLLGGAFGPSFSNGKFYPYKDSTGHYTIGYGHYIGKNARDANRFRNGITRGEAHNILVQDMKRTMDDFKLLLQRKRAVNLSTEQQRVLYEMAFNLGVDKLSKFNKMWKHKDDNHRFKTELKDSLWYKQVGGRADMLLGML